MHPFEQALRDFVGNSISRLATIPEKDEVYIVFLWPQLGDEDAREPGLIVSYNTESAVERNGGSDEARWSFACWHDTPELGTFEDPHPLLRSWLDDRGLWYEDDDPEEWTPESDEAGGRVIDAYIELLIDTVRHVYESQAVEAALGRRALVTIASETMPDECLAAAQRANPGGLPTAYMG